MKPLADQDARDCIRSDLDSTLIVEAAAGTGKTTELVNRVMALLRAGTTTLSRLVAVTFTEKAAGEMKLRLRTEIERARSGAGPEESARLDVALKELEEAHIGTIHGFCAELLRQRPVEARVDPLFEGADEDQQERLFDEAFDRWFQTTLANPPEGVRRVLRRKAQGGRGPAGPRVVLRAAGLALVDQRDFQAPWRRDPLDRAAAIDGVVSRLAKLAELAPMAQDKEDWAAQSIATVARFVSELARREAIVGRDHDGLEEELRALARNKGGKFWTWKGKGKWFAQGITREAVLEQRAETKRELDRVLELADADLAACLRRDLAPLVEAYEVRKTRAGKLDFLDLLLFARNLVRDQRAVRVELQKRFSHLLVDEFQDTDPLQAEILLLLAADDPEVKDFQKARPVPGKLFLVGDPKQSIYRFRRADVGLYEATKRRLVSHGAKLVHLTTSFRSAPAIQEAVNAAFAPKMKGNEEGSQAEYVPLHPYREPITDRPTVIALPVPRPYTDWGRVASYMIEKSLPDAVGAFVDWLIRKSGWTVTERKRGEAVPIEARHVCLLFRRFVNWGQDVTRPYVKALEARRIPHVLVGGRSFHKREEVLALRNALLAIEWPDDELSVFATLHGPFFALGDDALLTFRSRHGSLHPLRRYDGASLDEVTAPVVRALEVLKGLHVGRNRRPTAVTVSQLLDRTRAHAGVANWPTGEQALANLLRILDLGRRFEAMGATSFRAFVQKLEEDAERGGVAEAPVVEEGTDGVRIMTVHKAKGLEFPVVILVDPTCNTVQREPSRYVDATRGLWVTPLAGCAPVELLEHGAEVLRQDEEEAVRLAYVAATRARDLLVVPVVGDEKVEGWVDVFHPVVYPKGIDRRNASPAPACPPFGDDSVYERPVKSNRWAEDSVRPGLHRPEAGKHDVVWWDPHALELGKEEEAGLRQQRILAADEAGAAAEGERAYGDWEARRKARIDRGVTPTLRVESVTAARARARAPGVPVELESTSPSRDRPRGARFGTLVHAILADVPFHADDGAVRVIARAKGRLVGASDEEVDAAATATRAALRHDLFRRARAAGSACRRETPVKVTLEDGSFVEGVLDLAFRDGNEWVVVDYKTDVEIETKRAEYEEQVRLYARAVSIATGIGARAVLLRV